MSSEKITEADLKIDEGLLSQINEKMIGDNLITPDSLYVELRLFRDLFLAAVITLIDTQEQYDILLSKLDQYKDRAFDDVEKLYPELGITNKQVQDRVSDPTWHDRLFTIAPSTNFVQVMHAQIAVNVNHSSVQKKLNTVEMVVNTYPLRLNEANTHLLGLYLSRAYGVNVHPVCIAPESLTLAYLAQFHEYYVYHTQAFLKNDEVHKGLSELKFLDKRIFAARLYGNTHTHIKSLPHADMYYTSTIDVVSSFKFLHPTMFGVPTAKDNQAQAPEEVNSGKQ